MAFPEAPALTLLCATYDSILRFAIDAFLLK
jgi:hypothetical protein